MRRPRAAAVLLLLACASTAAAAVPASPAATVREFVGHFAAGDVVAARQLWTPETQSGFAKRWNRAISAKCRTLASVEATEEVRGDSAAVTVRARFIRWSEIPPAVPSVEERAGRASMRRTSDGWRIEAWDDLDERLADEIANAQPLAAVETSMQASGERLTPRVLMLLCRRAIVLVNRRDFERATEITRLASRAAEAVGDLAAMAEARGNESVVARRRDSEDARSVELAREAVALANASGDPDAIVRANQRLVRAQLEAHERLTIDAPAVLALATRVEDPASVALLATQLARDADQHYLSRRALAYSLVAERFAAESGDAAAIVGAEMNVGGAYETKSDWELALVHWRRAEAMARDARFGDTVAFILKNVAYCELQTGRVAAAQTAIDDALTALGDSDDVRMLAQLHVTRAGIRTVAGDFKEAQRDVEIATAAASRAGDSELLQGAHVVRTRLLLAQNKLQDALAAAAMAGSARPYLSAQALWRLGRMREAEAALRDAVDEYERLRSEVSGDARQQWMYLSARVEPYQELIELLLDERRPKAALEVAELTHARALRDVAAQDGGARAGRPAGNDESTRAVERRLTQLNTQMRRTDLSKRERAEVTARIAAARFELEELQARRYVNDAHGGWEIAAAKPLSLPSPSNGLVVLEYADLRSRLVVFTIRRGTDGRPVVKAHRINASASRIARLVQQLADGIESGDLDSSRAARALYDLVVAPAQRELDGARTICVIPDGVLWRVPFHALEPRRGHPLVETHAVFYAPSIAFLTDAAAHARVRRNPGREILAVATAVFDAPWAEKVRTLLPGVPLGALPDADREVREVRRVYGSGRATVMTGQAATEAAFKRAVSQYDVVHLATHAFVDETQPMYSALVLGTDEAVEDGLLEAREIAEMRIDARLAVLSACDTATGAYKAGEGVVGLSWAMMAAGCPTIAVSQWKAASAATADLMIRFHRWLRDGKSPAEALRRAQLEMRGSRRRYERAFYWAPFVIVGAGHVPLFPGLSPPP